MERMMFIFGIVLTALLSCTTTKSVQQDMAAGDNSRNALNWAGVYSGMLPSTYGDGIQAMIKLYSDYTYELQWKYMDKRVADVNKKGKFSWDASGSNITLEGVEVIPDIYKVGENKLLATNKAGRVIKNNLLMKDTSSILERYWKLTAVKGEAVSNFQKAISEAPAMGKEPHMKLKVLDSKVSGNGGCNGYGGTYTLGAGNKIRFSPIISTKMACYKLNIENAFFSVFEFVDHYEAKGGTLVLFDVNSQELARFVTF